MTEWIEHTGNGCPVDENALVDVRFFSYRPHIKAKAGSLGWNSGAGITHYRLAIKEQEDQPAQTVVDYLRKGAQILKSVDLDSYDAGYLPDNPDQDYVRYKLARAEEFYKDQLEDLAQQLLEDLAQQLLEDLAQQLLEDT